MKQLILWLAILLPYVASAQTAGTIQKTSATGTIRGSFGSLGVDTIPRITGVFTNGYVLKYNSSTNKWYAAPSGTPDTAVYRTVANSRSLAQTQTALNLKANLASPTFTGTVTIPSGSVLGTPTTLVGTNITGLPLTTGVTGVLPIANGGTNSSTAPTARTALGGTTIGQSVFTLTNPSAITFPRYNADNTVSALDAATFRTAIGAGTGGGSVTGVTGTANQITVTGTTAPVISLPATITGLTSITSTGFTGALTGNASTATLFNVSTDNATNAVHYPTFVTAISGNQGATIANTKLMFNPSTGNLSSTLFTGALTGNASSATLTTISNDNGTNATVYPTWVSSTSGNQGVTTSSTKLNFNPFSGVLTATGFSGGLSGNALSASALQTARTIGGVSFNGTADITVLSATAGFNITNGNLSVNNGANTRINGQTTDSYIRLDNSIGSQLAYLTKSYFVDGTGVGASTLTGAGSRMVVADAGGYLSTQAIPGGGGGSVTGVAVASSNGLAGTSDGASVVPTLTLRTTINSPVLAGNGTAISAATATGTGSTVVMSASPTFTGTPTAPTATAGTNTTQVATTAFVQGAITLTGATSGKTSPTATAGANVNSTGNSQVKYIRVGNFVTVTGQLDVGWNSTSSTSIVYVDFPIASSIASFYDVIGLGSGSTSSIHSVRIEPDSTNDRAQISFGSIGSISGTIFYTYSYEVY